MRKFIFAICLVILLGIKFSPETVIAASDGIACEVSQHSVNIDWADALGEHNYKDVVVILSDKTSKEIERYNIEDGETSYTISNLDGGTRYMIEIKGTRVYDDETNGEWENWGIANFDICYDVNSFVDEINKVGTTVNGATNAFGKWFNDILGGK